MAIKVTDANIGPKIPYAVKGNKITFNDDLQLDLGKRERDSEVKIDIYEDIDGALTTGPGIRFIARICIPARKYNEVQNGTDTEGRPQMTKEPVAFSVLNVELLLFALKEQMPTEEPEKKGEQANG